jgi:uncharacterized protein YbaR (Trm112 family)
MSDAANEVDPKLLEILVCPVTKGPLEYDRAANELISRRANLAFPIRDGMPIMLVDEARPLDQPPRDSARDPARDPAREGR